MKRIHIFEFEDFPWFPKWLRDPMTRYLVSFHRLVGTGEVVASLLDRALQRTGKARVVDVCSGGGGPMVEVFDSLKSKYGRQDLEMILTDLYPNTSAAAEVNGLGKQGLSFRTEPVDATDVPADLTGVRCMVGSFHHMTPELGRKILQNTFNARQAIVIVEPSDNSSPKAIWWLSIPFVFLSTFFITPKVRPMKWQQLVFTYIIPLLPLFIAWDGAVSNARIYTQGDYDELLVGMKDAQDYEWEYGVVKGKGRKSYLLGLPK